MLSSLLSISTVLFSSVSALITDLVDGDRCALSDAERGQSSLADRVGHRRHGNRERRHRAEGEQRRTEGGDQQRRAKLNDNTREHERERWQARTDQTQGCQQRATRTRRAAIQIAALSAAAAPVLLI